MTPSPITYGPGHYFNGKCYPTLEEAQTVALARVLDGEDKEATSDAAMIAAKNLVAAKEAVLAILTLGPKSRPRARGAKKPRVVKEPKTAVAP